ncbi:S-type pyocin domain-containing protein [Pseudomonas nunensis]|uniref:S-type pyocin domain-containing protein n=1 Tax=Pseudomonas nunensis TaxID=2961896 RepID=UPI000A45F828|nr:S-type pyocin domain-containing protein [Pseudomonas nunensis]
MKLPTVSGAVASARPLVITSDGVIAGFEGSPFSFNKAIESLSSLRGALSAGPVSAFLASAFYTPTLGNGELQRTPVVVTIPLSQLVKDSEYKPLGYPTNRNWLPFRVVASVRGEHTQLYLHSPDVLYPARVRQADLDPTTNLYTFKTEGLVPITLTWTPETAPGSDVLGGTELPVTESGIKIYPGARVTQIEGRVDEHPACDFDYPDDYILEFPIESGLESIYMMATRGGPRYEPGTATGRGQEVGGNWLGSANEPNGAPIPAHIADQLRGQDFRSFDKFRESFWKAISTDEELSQQFGKVDREQMFYGAAPYSEPIDSVGGREKIEIHHKQRITDGGAVYDMENLSILTPKAHIDLHKKGTQQ